MWSTTNRITRFLSDQGLIKSRPNASPGVWLMYLLPLALIISTAKHPAIASSTYKLSSLFAVGLICTSTVFIAQCLKNHRQLSSVNWWNLAAGMFTSILFNICLHRGILFSVLSGMTATIIYHKIYIFLLKRLQYSFTLGEAAIVTQSLVMLLYFTAVSLSERNFFPHRTVMQIETIIIQLGLLGIATIASLIYLLNIRKTFTVYTTCAFAVVSVIFLPLHILLNQSPVLWIIQMILDDISTLKIVLYWIICSALAVIAINYQIKFAQKASTSIRKIFHILAVIVYIPGLLYNCSFLYLSSGIVLGIFFALEIFRILNVPPLGQHLRDGYTVYSDDKDLGLIAFTPIYLLAGCSLPLWIHPAPCDLTNSSYFHLLPLLSGLLTTGIGDTAASIVGSKIGKHRWLGTRKTVEGFVACVLSQLIVIYALNYLDYLKFTGIQQYVKTVVAVVVSSVVEASSDQIDNLVLPLIMYIILIL